MTTDDEIRLFSMVDVLEPLSQEDLAALHRRTPVVELDSGLSVYGPKYQANMLFFLLEGQVRIYKAVGGRELTLELVESGTMFGETAYNTELQNVYEGLWAETTEPSSIAMMRREAFGRLVKRNPEVGLRAIRLLDERLYATANRMADVAFKEVPARLASMILYLIEHEGIRGPEGFRIPTRYTHRQLGAMIGADRVAVTRAFNTLRETGAVEPKHRRIHVRDIEALRRLAWEDDSSWNSRN